MAMAKAACRSHRRDVIFDPYPTVVDPDNSKELSFNPKVIISILRKQAVNKMWNYS